MSTDALQQAAEPEADSPEAGQQVAAVAEPTSSDGPSLSDLDKYLNQPFKPEFAHLAEAVPTDGQPPAPVAEAQPAAEATAEDLDLIDLLKQDPDGERFLAKYGGDPVKFVRGSLEAMKLASRRDDELARLREYQQATQQTQVQQPVQPEQPKFWDAPPFKKEWMSQVKRDENGKLVGPADAVQGLETFARYAEQKNLEVLADLPGAIRPSVRHEAADVARQEAQQVVQQMAMAHWAQETERKYQPYVFNNSDQSQGLTEFGQVFMSYGNQAKQLGIRPGPATLQYIEEKLQRDVELHQARTKQAQTIAQPAARANAAAATHSPSSASPTPANPMALHKPGEDLEAAVLRNIRQYGALG